MAKIDIAPPPPPKFLKEEKKEEEPLPSAEEKSQEDTPNKKGFLNKLFAKKKISEISEEEVPKPEDELDLEKLRSDFGIPKKEKKKVKTSKKKPSKDVKWHEHEEDEKHAPSGNWHEGDLVEEFHKPKKKDSGWDVEEFDPLAEPSKPKKIVSKKKSIKPAIKKVVKKKAVVKKHIKKSVKPAVKKVSKVKTAIKKQSKKALPKKPAVKPKKPSVVKKVALKKAKKPIRSKVDKVIEEYFKSVEKEQRLIQKELDMIVVHPKKALKKGPEEYIIHHNEKLINSMKELLAAIKSIDNEKFERKVQNNKKAFYEWVKGILEKEKKAEQQRNKILKQKIKEILKEYGAGINKDITDKKYELNSEKKSADKRYRAAEMFKKKLEHYDLRLKKTENELKQKEKDINNIIEEKIQKIIDKRLKKEKLSMQIAETKANKKVKAYDTKSEQLKNEWADFNKHRDEAMQLLEEADTLRRRKAYLERKDARLKKDIEELTVKDKDLKAQTKDLETREQELEANNKKLVSENKKLEKMDKNLLQREKELKLELRDYETRLKELEMREKESAEMEDHLAHERGDLHEIKDNLMYREREAKEKLEEVREIENEIEIEEKKLEDERKDLEDTGFRKYLHSKFNEISDKDMPAFDSKVGEFYNQIETCKTMLRNNQFEDAKRLYSDIRTKFSQADLKPDDKEILYNTIRELYDNIYLAVISNV